MRNRLINRRDERGAALLEFSIVFLLLVTVLYGLIALGMVVGLKQSVTNAAAEGARAAIGARQQAGETLPQAQARVAKARVASALNWLGSKYDPNDVTALVAYCEGSSGPQCITVTIDYPYGARPLVPHAPGLKIVTPDHLKTTAKVQL
jgi:Flp pilus assembly protein TadG